MARVVAEIRAKVREATGGLTCSAGIGPNFMVAKIASDQNKPNGQFLVPFTRAGAVSFLHGHSTRKVGGIGKVTERVLREVLAVGTVRELYERRGAFAYSGTIEDVLVTPGDRVADS